LCETIDGGRLREAAEAKNDEGILLHIRGKDCVAAEVRYHNHCYYLFKKFPVSDWLTANCEIVISTQWLTKNGFFTFILAK
jgi:hypothetical protein